MITTDALARPGRRDRNMQDKHGRIFQAAAALFEAHGYAELLDGRAYDCQYHFLITIRGGKVGDVKEYMDTQHAKETLFGS